MIDLATLADEPMKLSHSKLKTWRRCPRQFRYKYVEGLRTRSPALPLKRGSWLHELIESHYTTGHWEEHNRKLTGQFMELFEEEREEYGDLPNECARIMRSYVRHWAKEDSHLKIVDAELDEILPLPNGDTFNFVIDLVVEDTDGGLWLWDHKTVGSFMPADFMLLDAQLARYFWAAEFMGYKPLRGVMFNEIITKPPTAPDLLKSGKLTERQNLHCDAYTYAREIKRHGLDIADYADTLRRLLSRSDQWFRRTPLPRDKVLMDQLMLEMYQGADEIRNAYREDAFPRTPDKSCTWGCDYLGVCSIELMGGDASHLKRSKFTTKGDEYK